MDAVAALLVSGLAVAATMLAAGLLRRAGRRPSRSLAPPSARGLRVRLRFVAIALVFTLAFLPATPRDVTTPAQG